MKDKKHICSVPFVNLELYTEGRVSTCCPMGIKNVYCGNINDNNIEAVMNSDFSKKLRKKILKGDYSLCDPKICTARNTTNNLIARYFRDKKVNYDVEVSYPRVVQFGQDNECNLHCISCRKETYRNRVKELDELNSKIDEVYLPMLKGAEIAYLSNSGDPFASRHYRTFIKRIVDTYPAMKFILHTNGMLCNERACRELGIIDKIESVGVSIHAATKETYESIARGGKFEVLLENLEWLSRMKKQGKINHISLFFVISQMNYKEMPEFVELAKKYNANACFWVYHKWSGIDDKEYEKMAVSEPFHPEHTNFIKILQNPILKTNDTEFNPVLSDLMNIKNVKRYFLINKIKRNILAFKIHKLFIINLKKNVDFADKFLLAILLSNSFPFKKFRRNLRRATDNTPLKNMFLHPIRTFKKLFKTNEFASREMFVFYCKILKTFLTSPKTLFCKKSVKNFIIENKPSKKAEKKIVINKEAEKVETVEFNFRNIPKKIKFEKVEKPLVSIVIPVYNQFKFTYACLYSILNHTKNIDYEIIIADDCSTDKTKKISEFVENIKIIRTTNNLGFLKNCNNAIMQAKGEYICLLNNDTQVQPQWLDWMLDLFKNEKNVGIVGSKMLYAQNKLQEAGTLIYKDLYFQGRLDAPTKSMYSYVKEVDYVPGCCVLTPKKLFDEIGGFDEIYAPAYNEDPDYCYQLKKRGYKVLYQPKSIILHYEGVSYGKSRMERIEKNRDIFNKRWAEELSKKTTFEEIKVPFTEKMRPKTILVIDDKLPEYDQHAGAKTIFHFIKLLKKMGMHIKFLPADYLLREPYATALGQLGAEVLTDYQLNDKEKFKQWLNVNHHFVDYVLISRPQVAEQYLGIVKEYKNIKVLYYGHDLHYLRELRDYELTKRQDALSCSNFFKAMEFDIFNKVDMSYYPSQFEVETIKKEMPMAKAKAVPAYLYDITQAPVQKNFESKKDLMFVGGFGHLPNVDGILWFVREVFPMVLEKLPDIKLNILGSRPTEEILELQSDSINILGYVQDDVLAEYYQNCRIVVAPLRFGAGVKGKVIEAIYNRIPVVTTKIGAEGINQGDVLTIADEPIDFANELVDLYNNKERYEHIVQNSLNIIRDNFSYEKAIKIFSQDIDTAYRENEIIEERKCL